MIYLKVRKEEIEMIHEGNLNIFRLKEFVFNCVRATFFGKLHIFSPPSKNQNLEYCHPTSNPPSLPPPRFVLPIASVMISLKKNKIEENKLQVELIL